MTPATPGRSGGARWGSARVRLLAGSFLLVFCAWTVDTLSQDRGPKRAAAAQVQPAAGAFVIADPADRDALDRFLGDHESQPAPLVIDVSRDPFVIPADRTIAGPAVGPAPAESQPAERIGGAAVAASAPSDRQFSDVHRFTGVISGARPLALIDGNGYRVGDWIDGYRIVAMSRDAVELSGREGRVILRVAGPNLMPGRRAPSELPIQAERGADR